MRGFSTAALLAFGVACCAPAFAADRTIIVLDGSGSMWGQIDGKPKLEIARETLASVLATVPPELELGLMAYGHRQKGACEDIELIVPPAPGTAARIGETAAAMRFLGKTPLSAAVEQAADALRETEDRATVILITDGIETCDADPCAVGAALAQAGIDLTVHVVGFGLSRDEGRQVACLAENTGGRYIPAADAGELDLALNRTIAPPAPSAESEKVALPDAAVTPETKVGIGADFAVEWSGPGGDGDYVDLVPVGHAETRGEIDYRYIEEDGPLRLRAPGRVGSHEVRYVWRGPDRHHVLARSAVEVVDSEFALIAPPSVAVGQQFDVAWKGPANRGDYVDLVPEGYAETGGELSYSYVEQDRKSEPATLRAPAEPGAYRIRYVLQAPDARRVTASVPLGVTPATAMVALPPKVGAGAEVSVAWAGPANRGDYVDLVPAGFGETSGELSYFYVDSSPDGETGMLRAPAAPGAYTVRYVMQAADGRRVLARQAVEVTAVDATLAGPRSVTAGARFAVEWSGPAGRGDYVDLVPAGFEETGGELSYFYTDGDGGRGTLQAPRAAGDYRIRYVQQAADARAVLAARPVAVLAAAASLSAPEATEAQTEFAVAWTGPANDGDYVDLVPAGHDEIGGELSYAYLPAGSGEGRATLKAPDEAGEYVIRYILSASDGHMVLESRPIAVQ